MIQSAIDAQWPDDKLADRLLQKLQPWVGASLEAPPPQEGSSGITHAVHAPRTEKGKGREGKEADKGKGTGKGMREGVPAGPPGAPLLQATPKQAPKPKPGPGPPPPLQTSEGKFAARVLPSEWDSEVRLLSVGQLRRALTEGTEIPGNVIVCRDSEVKSEVQALVDAFSVECPLAFACVTDAAKLLPTVSVWWNRGKEASVKPSRVKLQVSQMTKAVSPDIRAPISIQFRSPKGPRMCTLRVTAPAAYRRVFLDRDTSDNPQIVVGELTKLIGCKASALTGGRWQLSHDKEGPVLTAHLRLPEETATKVTKVSGRRGIFSLILVKTEERARVVWVPRPNNTGNEEYFRYATAEAERQSKTLSFRMGGKEDLGITDGDENTFPKVQRPRVWEACDVPRGWCQEDVVAFFLNANWQMPEVITRRKPKGRAKAVWIVKALAPPDTAGPYCYEDFDQGTCISILPEAPRSKPVVEAEVVLGPKKLWVEPVNKRRKGQSDTVPPTLVDVPSESESDDAAPAGSDEEGGNARSRSPKGGRHKAPKTSLPAKPVDLDDMLLHSLHVEGFSIHDSGGCGDCAFRSVASCVAHQKDKQLSHDEIIREAATLRLLTVAHLTKHRARFQNVWAPDTAPSEETLAVEEWTQHEKQYWAGEVPPADFEAFLRLLAKRETYACGFSLAALSERLGAPIIIWLWVPQQRTWQRCVLAPFEHQGFAGKAKKAPEPIVLVLKDNHYRSLLGPIKCPQAWLQVTSPRPPKELRGAGKSRASGHLTLPSATPPRNKGETGALSLPSATPSRQGGVGYLSLPVSTPRYAEESGSSLRHRPGAGLEHQASRPSTARALHCAQAQDSVVPASAQKPACDSGLENASSVMNLTFMNSDLPAHAPAVAQQAVQKGPRKRLLFKQNPSRPSSAPTLGPSDSRVLFWKCDVPGCGFSVWRHGLVRGHHEARVAHLMRVHGMSRQAIPRLQRQRGAKPHTKRRRNGAEKRQAALERVKHRRAKQDSNSNSAGSSHPPQAMGGLPVYKADALDTRVWWPCNLCEYEIKFADFPQDPNRMYRARVRHLKQVHGIAKPPCLKKGLSNKATVPNRVNEASESYEARWKAVWQLYQAKRWKGSHDIACEVHTWREYQRPSGHMWCRPYHECRACKVLLSRDALITSVCSQNRGRAPELSRRKAIWKDCRKAGKAAVKDIRALKKRRRDDSL